MRWWHHLMTAGALTLLYDVYWFNVIGGVVFGIGFAWLAFRRLRSWSRSPS